MKCPLSITWYIFSALYQYVGCLRDALTRDLTTGVSHNGHIYNIETCSEACHNYSYFGVQAGNQCFCGATYGRYEELTDSSCSATCEYDQTQTCGADWINSVYSHSVTATSELHL